MNYKPKRPEREIERCWVSLRAADSANRTFGLKVGVGLLASTIAAQRFEGLSPAIVAVDFRRAAWLLVITRHSLRQLVADGRLKMALRAGKAEFPVADLQRLHAELEAERLSGIAAYRKQLAEKVEKKYGRETAAAFCKRGRSRGTP